RQERRVPRRVRARLPARLRRGRGAHDRTRPAQAVRGPRDVRAAGHLPPRLEGHRPARVGRLRRRRASRGSARRGLRRVSIAAVRSSYEAFAENDLDRALAMMDDDIVWHQAQGLPHGGTYHGLATVRANVFDPLDESWWDEFDAAPDEIIGL